jgi:hypothetical protein
LAKENSETRVRMQERTRRTAEFKEQTWVITVNFFAPALLGPEDQLDIFDAMLRQPWENAKEKTWKKIERTKKKQALRNDKLEQRDKVKRHAKQSP